MKNLPGTPTAILTMKTFTKIKAFLYVLHIHNAYFEKLHYQCDKIIFFSIFVFFLLYLKIYQNSMYLAIPMEI